MAFQCALVESDEIAFNIFSRDNEHVITAYVGSNDSGEYSIMTAFSPMAGGNIEHVFCLLKANGGEVAKIWDGAATSPVIVERSHRRLILNAVLQATVVLLEMTKPQFIVHSTYADNLPVKALAKHQAVMQLFEKSGYKISAPDPYNGRKIWFAELLPPTAATKKEP